jgi:hypothetical protein
MRRMASPWLPESYLLGCPFSLGVRNSLHLHDVAGLAYPQLTIFQFRLKQLAFILSSSFNVKILVALPDGEGSGPWKEFMAEDFCDEDVLGHVFGFKAVAADSGRRHLRASSVVDGDAFGKIEGNLEGD